MRRRRRVSVRARWISAWPRAAAIGIANGVAREATYGKRIPETAEDTYRGPWDASTPNPILLINQRYDPATLYGNAVRAEEPLGNAVLLTHEGYGHLYFKDPGACVDKAIADYLVHLITPPPGTVCQSNHLPFDPEFGQ